MLAETGIDSILKYLASDPAQEVDNHVTGEVRNFLFGAPGAGGFDLASLNIQRGRDHGLGSYNEVRVAYGLRPASTFADITSDQELQAALEEAFGTVDNVELWPGGLAEDHVRGGSLGPLFRAIVSDQFERLRDGDRFWYERSLSVSELRQVRGTTLADVISRNTTTTNLQDDVFFFFFFNSIEGRVFLDGDGDGRADRNERGLRGVTVELLDEDGNVIASAITGRDDSYAFEELELGVYSVPMILPRGWQETTRGPYEIDLTRAEEFSSVNFGIKLRPRNVAPSDPVVAAEPNAALTAPVRPKKLLDPLDPRSVANR